MANNQKQPARATKKGPSGLKLIYLILYNLFSAVAWGTVLWRTVAINVQSGPYAVFPGIGEWTRWTQTVAGLEILHSLLGVVRAPIFTTLMQVASRYLLVWGIVYPFPQVAASPVYSTMLLAWSITEVIRYSYFALSLAGSVPNALVWLRYNTFYVLYPLGISSEAWLVYKAIGPAAGLNELFPIALYAILAIYVPGSYILYSHMMKQRTKVMKTLKENDSRKTQ
ncbi:unnamed protein product [Parascedosporium putredinis]|uniref:Very-long-chain (3R)-3-hydroxyacyl-CoA dehydratase n=1 Tax=Parascedosporium putredinis TaxID=1442378 RepID=A0A9P1H8D5_9PEZI|nr:unnamed protein product [Parascedosporium putredinis]CAI8000701.1 unnamed protein product [Parascedosporium putredinis]